MRPSRKEGLLWESIAEETVVWDKLQNRAHRLNRTASIVWKNADGKNTLDDLTAILSRELGTSEGTAGAVDEAVDRLARLGLLNEAEALGSRRELFRRAAIAAAVAVPLIATVAVPTPARAQSRISQ